MPDSLVNASLLFSDVVPASNLAFDKRIAMTNDPVVVRATAVSALPKNQQIFGSPKLT